MENRLENHIVMFVHILRNAGLTLGISEMEDALRAVTCLDITDKEQIRSGLRSVLVKSRHDCDVFEQAFDAYFVPDEQRVAQMAKFFADRDSIKALGDDLVFQGEDMDISPQDMETYASMEEKDRDKIRDFLDKANNGANVTADLKPVIEQQLHSILQRQRDVMPGFRPMPNSVTGVNQMDAVLYQMAENKRDSDLLLKNIADISDEEMDEAVVLIRRLSRVLATGIGRRYHTTGTHKTVDIRRSIRGALRYGGVMMDLKYKKHRIQKPDVTVLTDISGSMLKYSTFLLELMYGLSAVLPGIRCYVFAEKLKKLDLRSFNPESFTKDDDLGDGTDLFSSLKEFLQECDSRLTSKTVLIVLSDTKTVDYRKAAAEIEKISRRVKEIIWLNPMEASEWHRYSQVSAFAPHVSMVEASSIRRLTGALKNI